MNIRRYMSQAGRAIRSDDMSGGGWLRWFLMSHLMAGAGGLRAVLERDARALAIALLVMILGIALSVGFWVAVVHAWRKESPRLAGDADDRQG